MIVGEAPIARLLAFARDLRPLAPALALPETAAHSRALWGDLLATFGVAEHIARQTTETIRAAFETGYLSTDSYDDATLAAAVAIAATHPGISAIRLPVRG